MATSARSTARVSCASPGRIKDVIIRGAQNISATEIDELLSGQSMNEEEAEEFCKSSLARYKTPAYVWFVGSFPTNPMGKKQKFKLVERAIAHFGLGGERA